MSASRFTFRSDVRFWPEAASVCLAISRGSSISDSASRSPECRDRQPKGVVKNWRTLASSMSQNACAYRLVIACSKCSLHGQRRVSTESGPAHRLCLDGTRLHRHTARYPVVFYGAGLPVARGAGGTSMLLEPVAPSDPAGRPASFTSFCKEVAACASSA